MPGREVIGKIRDTPGHTSTVLFLDSGYTSVAIILADVVQPRLTIRSINRIMNPTVSLHARHT